MSKLHTGDITDLVSGLIRDGMSIAVGGFGLSGSPFDLIEAVNASGAKDLTIVSNNMSIDGIGLGLLLESQQVKKVMASYVGENKAFAEQYLAGQLELEFVPQGSLAERLRAAGAGIPAFFTPTGYGTIIAEGKEVREINGRHYILEEAIRTDLALVHAATADPNGNLVYNRTARNFNPVCAMAGRITIAQAEQVVELGDLDPDFIHTPGVYVQHLVQAVPRIKPIERVTTRPRPEGNSAEKGN
ncbi:MULTISPECIES: CoA transferase subunit A [unclassified Corynebacterium]|uniref:CoA transferase subunit A n=1 Tax=unclassified Corynebacterium TaxID=2624378 RepID=UPI0035248C95